jgi:hypothetical protein
MKTMAENPLWLRDDIQFPRLLAEILAVCGDKLDYDALCASMDLEPSELDELFDRADIAWEKIKKENCPPKGRTWLCSRMKKRIKE